MATADGIPFSVSGKTAIVTGAGSGRSQRGSPSQKVTELQQALALPSHLYYSHTAATWFLQTCPSAPKPSVSWTNVQVSTVKQKPVLSSK